MNPLVGKLDKIILSIAAIIILLGAFGKNSLEAMAAAVSFGLLYLLLYKENEPSVLFIGILLQWTQVTVRVFDTSLFGKNMADAYEYNAHISEAYYHSLLGLVFLSFGIFETRRRFKPLEWDQLDSFIVELDFKRFLYVFIASIPLSAIAMAIFGSIPGLQLFGTKIAMLKWFFFFIAYILAFRYNYGKNIFLILLTGQFVLSFTGYFSSFKDFFISVFLCYLFNTDKFKRSQMILVSLFAAIAFLFGIYWQTIKGDYRQYLTQGEISQNVNVDKTSAFIKLKQLVDAVDEEKFIDGRERFLSRLSYIGFFSSTIGHVPEKVPHEKGKLFFESLIKVFTPRILFPDKEIIDDSKKTNKYSGVRVSGAESATSVSLGYLTECYIDFGFWYMNILLFSLGYIIGFVYQKIIAMAVNPLWGFGIVFCMFPSLYLFESALDKVIPDIVAFYIVMYLLNRYGYIDKVHTFVIKGNKMKL